MTKSSFYGRRGQNSSTKGFWAKRWLKKLHAPTKIEHDFLHFMVKSLFLGSESVSTVTLFKILNDLTIDAPLDLYYLI